MTATIVKHTGRAPAVPTDLKSAARGLRNAGTGLGSHQRGALAAAIHMGQYLHWVREELGPASNAFGEWIRTHFEGGYDNATRYRQLAEAYFSDPSAFTGVTGIEEAREIARTVDTRGLPQWIGPERQDPKRRPPAQRMVMYPLTQEQLLSLSGLDSDGLQGWMEDNGIRGRRMSVPTTKGTDDAQ